MLDELMDIEEKILAGERLTREDGVKLMRSSDILGLGHLADMVRKKMVGDNAYFNCNLNINYTNICVCRCPLCAFSCDSKEEGGYLLSLEEIEEKVISVIRMGVHEVHIVGGLHPSLPFSYLEEILQRIKGLANNIFIQAFTATEIDYYAGVSGISIEEALIRLKDAGLDCIPGGGAEIFSPRVRKIIAPKKIPGERWLKVMETAHGLGLHSNATMLYGHVETPEERVEHIIAIRELQDRTAGFLSFVPLAFHPNNTKLSNCKGPDGFDDLRVFATSRILLDNIIHIKGLWMYLGEKLAEVTLCFGVDDLGGTSLEEKIVHAAGAITPVQTSREILIRMLQNAGRCPKEVNSIYGGVKL
ncbi:aminofutalosine synthase MqnE [Candidatus Desantisbacteria bacterium CG2_30_40_21]|uniref:Aminofutalosine synthase MqnE n=5 Tax=unclassified Candidatus Desantisiibacteriota TaxID=3106372 RepID=A0A2M7J8X9_9BACT|nr:MAG: aminofutalosine synthase MqnE [Candidatus Desantisbacteria bacterium CG2_30_40_21]PIP39903.1 MAG: aminofutalosine synthase MqnE [Candidatus Desantisbacteria bacterium CG23_combo_of_CG06-09_8_20_14_all_40_23]PIX15867.1 MAG: aminofutalosine synthase MqnE [Candidatus Desantisbacteria bacterium CG_4_8_14_3_um_filter_40_12]PIY18693.1 MAG: aminofutalosine synthase MqnE [Candidatus Desantisbacteria bacterium CG_4_10_14_3_um_filter_40_18]PJB29926.1 MAG: aminofutalosine synthase MqnE [Candidatus